MADLRSDYIAQIYGAITKKEDLIIVMEYCEGGSLRQVLDALDGTPWEVSRQISVAIDIAFGMEYLHSQQVIHRDLKSPNILITGSGVAKVTDFGQSKSATFNTLKSRATSQGSVGTVKWNAPEVDEGEITKKSDVFSFSVILWELLTAGVPWKGLDIFQVGVGEGGRGEGGGEFGMSVARANSISIRANSLRSSLKA